VVAQAVLDREVRRRAAQVLGDRPAHRLDVVGVIGGAGDPLAARPQRLAAVPEDLLGARREEEAVAAQVPVPQALVRAVDRELVALFGAAQRFLGALLRVDVAHRAGPAARAAVGVAHRMPRTRTQR
jgi:hypothetical protein